MTFFKRRHFLKALTVGSVAAALPKAGTAMEMLGRDLPDDDAFSLLTPPYLQHLAMDGVTVCWITDKPAFSHVEYWPADAPQDVKIQHTVKDGLVLANNRINKIRLSGLKPGQSYAYRVVSKEIVEFKAYSKTFGSTVTSETFSFRTVDPDSKTAALLVMNDVHDRPHSFAVLESLYGSKDYQEVLLNGDTFDYQTGEQQLIDHLIKPCTALFASNKPFMLMRGNHETRGDFAYALGQYFENIDDTAYFAFTRGPVFFVALDTGEDKADDADAYHGMAKFDEFREKQAAWLKTVLESAEAKKARYRVVLMHIPPYHSGDWHGTMHCQKVFGPVLANGQVDLVISGHTHRYGVHEAQKDHPYPIMIGGGPKEGQRTIVKVEANQDGLEAQLILETKETVGRVLLKPRQLRG